MTKKNVEMLKKVALINVNNYTNEIDFYENKQIIKKNHHKQDEEQIQQEEYKIENLSDYFIDNI